MGQVSRDDDQTILGGEQQPGDWVTRRMQEAEAAAATAQQIRDTAVAVRKALLGYAKEAGVPISDNPKDGLFSRVAAELKGSAQSGSPLSLETLGSLRAVAEHGINANEKELAGNLLYTLENTDLIASSGRPR